MQGLVENQQVGVFDEGACHEHHALLAAGEVEEGAVGQLVDAEEAHPPEALLALVGGGAHVEAYGVLESAGYDMQGGQVTVVAAMHLGRDVAYASLDVPDAHACLALTVAEESDVAGVALWVVGTDEREQRGLAGSVLAGEGPVLALTDGPVEVAQNGALAVADGDVVEADDFGAVCGRGEVDDVGDVVGDILAARDDEVDVVKMRDER